MFEKYYRCVRKNNPQSHNVLQLRNVDLSTFYDLLRASTISFCCITSPLHSIGRKRSAEPTWFEEQVQKLGLNERTCEASRERKQWCERNNMGLNIESVRAQDGTQLSYDGYYDQKGVGQGAGYLVDLRQPALTPVWQPSARRRKCRYGRGR